MKHFLENVKQNTLLRVSAQINNSSSLFQFADTQSLHRNVESKGHQKKAINLKQPIKSFLAPASENIYNR